MRHDVRRDRAIRWATAGAAIAVAGAGVVAASAPVAKACMAVCAVDVQAFAIDLEKGTLARKGRPKERVALPHRPPFPFRAPIGGGRLVEVGGHEGAIWLWTVTADGRKGAPLMPLDGRIAAVIPVVEGDHLVRTDRTLRRVDLTTGAVRWTAPASDVQLPVVVARPSGAVVLDPGVARSPVSVATLARTRSTVSIAVRDVERGAVIRSHEAVIHEGFWDEVEVGLVVREGRWVEGVSVAVVY
jgi:hypothetical protein